MCVAFAEESDRERLFCFQSVIAAAMACRRRKRNTLNALKFEINWLENCLNLSAELRDGTYQPSRSLCFVVTAPKMREVFASDFRDRVVHHLVVPHLEHIFEPKFIHDSYACRKNRGTHRAVERLQSFMRRVSVNGNRPAYFLQLDIHNFFMSLDHSVLLNLIRKHVPSGALLSLTEQVIKHDCTQNFIFRGDLSLRFQLPLHKSLFHLPQGKGLPIGNLSSQFFANVVLNELDQFVKHQLKCKFYLRYMDDFILLHSSKTQLEAWKQKIELFLGTVLLLKLKPHSVLKRVNEGADFLGYIIRPHYRLVRNRVVGNLKNKLHQFEEEFLSPQHFLLLRAPPERQIALRQVLASYLGHFKHANAYGLTHSLWKEFPFLDCLLSCRDLACTVSTAHVRSLHWMNQPPYDPANLKAQYRWFCKKYRGVVLFFQRGNHCEFYDEQAQLASKLLGLKCRESRRKNFALECGFPLSRLAYFKKRMQEIDCGYVVIAENGHLRQGLKRRCMTELYSSRNAPLRNDPM